MEDTGEIGFTANDDNYPHHRGRSMREESGSNRRNLFIAAGFSSLLIKFIEMQIIAKRHMIWI